MSRSRAERDRLFFAYEKLAEKAAGHVWGVWAEGLTDRGYTLDDLRQQAKADLLELAGSAKDVGGGFPTYVWRTLTGSLRNSFINSGILRDPDRIQQKVLENLPDSLVEPPDETVYYTMGDCPSKADVFCEHMLSGDSEAAARRAVGWAKADQLEAMARLRRGLGRG